MKKISLLLLAFGCTFGAFSQLTQGKVVYSMSYTSDDPELESSVDAMAGSEMSYYFMPGKSRSDVSLGKTSTTIIISDDQAKKSIVLLDMSGMKLAMNNKYSELKDEADLRKESKVKLLDGQKEILGYSCSNMLLTSADNTTMEIWYTKDISASSMGQTYHNPLIPGFPLSFSFTENGMQSEFTAISIEKTADAKLFSLVVPADYE